VADKRISSQAAVKRHSLWGAVLPIAEIRFLTVDGRRLAYEVAGKGPLLLCPA
jgi:hypothetical protein